MKKILILSSLILLCSCSNIEPSLNNSINSISTQISESTPQTKTAKVYLNNINETEGTDFSKEPALSSFKNKFLNIDPLLFNDVTGVSKIFATELKINNETLVHSVRLGSSSTQGQFVVNTKIPVSKIVVNAHDYLNYVEYNNSWIHDKGALEINGVSKELQHSNNGQIINNTLIYEFEAPITSFTFKNTQIDTNTKDRIQLNYIEFIY